ncbi:MAG TPA: hypothetical protein VK641_16985 [Terriglobales bacterium]|nr:hypothetical protein [Terriglobales bacterium]
MRILKTGSLAVLFLLSTIGTLRADSISSDAFLADSQIVQADLVRYHSSPSLLIAVFDFALGNAAGRQAQAFLAQGNSKLAQIYFQTAITDFNQALAALGQGALPSPSSAVPDAGPLALLGLTGIALFGALARKYSYSNSNSN